MILASHNSWSYLRPKTWWMRLIRFTARCQRKNILDQYRLSVRCFDLRVRFKNWKPVFAHGIIEYEYTEDEVMKDLFFLNDLSDVEDPVYIRVVNEIRNVNDYTERQVTQFRTFCSALEARFPNIRFWGGQNLLKQQTTEYVFKDSPSCEELYSSVCPPRIIDDWWPWLYARFHNKKNLTKWTDKDILMIDYVDIR